MGQAEVLEYLKKNPNKWYLAKDFMNYFRLSRGAVVRILKSLYQQDLIIKKLAIDVIDDKSRLEISTNFAHAYKLRRINK